MDVIDQAMRRSRTVILSLLVILVGGNVAFLRDPQRLTPR